MRAFRQRQVIREAKMTDFCHIMSLKSLKKIESVRKRRGCLNRGEGESLPERKIPPQRGWHDTFDGLGDTKEIYIYYNNLLSFESVIKVAFNPSSEQTR